MAAPTAKDRLARVRRADSPARRAAGEGNASTAGDVAVEPKVRITVDLPESLHRALGARVNKLGGRAKGHNKQTVIMRLLEIELAPELEAERG